MATNYIIETIYLSTKFICTSCDLCERGTMNYTIEKTGDTYLYNNQVFFLRDLLKELLLTGFDEEELILAFLELEGKSKAHFGMHKKFMYCE